MDLKNKLLKDIHDLSNKSERPYAGVSEDLDSVKGIGSDVGTAILGVVKEILDGAQEDSLDGLKHRLKRVQELKKNLEKAQLGPEETGVLNSCISRVNFALESHVQQKRKILNAASGAISKITPHLGTAMLGMSYNNPVMQLAVMAGGKLSQIVKDKMQKNRENKDLLKGDAKKLYSSSLSQADQPLGPEDAPTGPVEPPLKPEEDFPMGSGGYKGGLEDFNSDGSSLVMESSPGYQKTGLEIASDVHFIAEELLQVIDGLKPLEEISKNIEKLVRSSESAEDAKDQLTLDSLENAAEGPSLPDGVMGKGKTPGGAKGGILGKAKGLLPDMKALGGVAEGALSGLTGALFSTTTLMIGGLVWALIDGVSGWLKSEDWGVSKISGFLGGMMGGTFSNKIVNVFANMGKWALIGATIGAPVFGIGAIAGGLIGALVGGLLGWIGGENIAGFFDDFGSWISDSWSTGFDMIKNFFLDTWDFAQDMVDSVNNVIDSIKLAIVGWVKGTIDWLVSKDPTGWAEGKFKPLTDGLGQMQDGLEKDIQQRAERREERAQKQQARHDESDAARKDRNDKYTANQEARAIKQEQWRSGESGGAATTGGESSQSGEFISSETGKPVPSTGFDGKPSMNVPGSGMTTEGGDLGGLSERYEAGKRGSAAIGVDSTGGTSYGKYQIATKTGTMNRFMNYLKENNPEAYQRLAAAGPADSGKSGKFAQEWQALAKEGKLGNSEHDFIKKTHFDVGMKGVKNENLSKMIQGNKALQEVMWSTSVQHGGGGASSIFNKAYKEGMSEQDLIQAVYANRRTKFGSSTAGVRASVMSRFDDEQKRALAMSKTPGVVAPESIKPDLQGAQVVPASYNEVNTKSAQMPQSGTTVINNISNTSSVSGSGGGAQSRPNDTGTSTMRPTAQRAWQT